MTESTSTWGSIAAAVGRFAPMLGTLLGGSAGGALGSVIASALGVENNPDAVSKAIATDPAAALKLKELESAERIKLQELAVQSAKNELEASVQSASDVNKTMQSESAAEHWPTYGWRPFIGFTFGANLLIAGLTTSAVYIAAMFGSTTASAALTSLPSMIGALGAINAAALPILGVASWFRGKMQADPGIPTTNRG